MHAAAGPKNIDHDKADHECEARHNLKINQRLDSDPPHLPGFPYGGHSMHNGAEDDQSDKYRDQPDKQIAKRAHQIGRPGKGPADKRPNGHADENLRRHVHIESAYGDAADADR